MRSTPWTLRRHVRDWISCFLPWRLPIDDEPDHGYCNSNPPLPRENNIPFDYSQTNLTWCNEGDTTRRGKRSGSGQEVAANSIYNKDMNIQPKEEGSDEESMWSNSGDEDYIVFAIKEDGDFEVLKHDNSDEASSSHLESVSENSKPINRKVREEENIYFDAQSDYGTNFEEYGVASAEPRDSTQSSNASTGSFTFPVLGWEWIGSPQKMPNSKGLSLRKHKARCVGFCNL